MATKELVEYGHRCTVHSDIISANDGAVSGGVAWDAVRSCNSEGPVPPGGKRNPLL